MVGAGYMYNWRHWGKEESKRNLYTTNKTQMNMIDALRLKRCACALGLLYYHLHVNPQSGAT